MRGKLLLAASIWREQLNIFLVEAPKTSWLFSGASTHTVSRRLTWKPMGLLQAGVIALGCKLEKAKRAKVLMLCKEPKKDTNFMGFWGQQRGVGAPAQRGSPAFRRIRNCTAWAAGHGLTIITHVRITTNTIAIIFSISIITIATLPRNKEALTLHFEASSGMKAEALTTRFEV